MTHRKQTIEEQLIREIDARRVARGLCRHCGGRVPCWSEFGDQRVGVRHSHRSHRVMRASATT